MLIQIEGDSVWLIEADRCWLRLMSRLIEVNLGRVGLSDIDGNDLGLIQIRLGPLEVHRDWSKLIKE